MIRFDLLSKDDFEWLFNGFEVAFLREPFIKSPKQLSKYMPKGFRAKNITAPQMIKAYIDAINDGERSLSEYVKKEIELQFNRAGVLNYIEDNRDNESAVQGLGITIISIMLWENQLRIPSYLTLLLCGIECSEACKTVSKNIYRTHFEALSTSSKESYERGDRKSVV